MERLSTDGVSVEESDLDLSAATQAFHTLRGIAYATNYEDVLAQHRDVLNPNVIWNIEFGLQLDNRAMRSAQRTRAELFYKLNALLRRYDVLICPASIVLPFPVEARDIRDAVGQHFETYIDWLAITYALTLTGMPVIAIPCGMSASGLPVGIQIVGKPRGEAALLCAARAIEEIIGTWATGKPQVL